MSGKVIGYIRVSSYEQNPERQLEGVKLDKTFIDKASGKDIFRPALENMLNYIREGDTIIVHSMDRLARNLDDLRKLVKQLTDKQIKIQFIKENLIFTGDDSPISKLLLSVIGGVAEFERALIAERQREGIIIAQKKGKYKGRHKSLSDEQVLLAKSKIANDEKKSHIALELGVSRETLYRYLRKSSNTKAPGKF